MSARKAAMTAYRCCWLVFAALVLAGLFAEPLVPFGLTFVPASSPMRIAAGAASRTWRRTGRPSRWGRR